jgi:S1-C subfamily serine protease
VVARTLAPVTLLDIGALVVIGLAAFSGFRRGLVIGACSLGGLAAGAYVGSKIAPYILRGETSVYPPLVAFGGAIVGAGVGQWLAVTGGRSVRELLRIGLLRAFDNLGGAVLGAITGLVFVWFIGSVLLYTPGDSTLRQAVQRSHIAGSLTSSLPPSRIIDVLARIDPFDALVGPQVNVRPGDPALLRDRQVVAAKASVLRVIGNACGLGIEGSGWIAAPGYVVTNAHVVAGVNHPYVDYYGKRAWQASVVAFDARDDLAVLRVPGLRGRPLLTRSPEKGTAVVVLGYPDDRPLRAFAGRLGKTVPTFARDAYGHFPVARAVTPIRAAIRPGNSGGPVVDANGRVRAVVFARRAGSDGGFGIPVQLVAKIVDEARRGDELRTACAES